MSAPRKQMISLRFNPVESARLEQLLHAWECDRSQAIRHLINRAFIRCHPLDRGSFTASNGFTFTIGGAHE